ncbi:MAG TPA: PAS domain S-box protein [Kofleriaceae bacterium]|nr:PAS domain S-box protein [Kofleriaceae bacterium]
MDIQPEDYARLLVDTVSAIVVALDTDGRIRFSNRGAEEITGYRADEVLGRDWFEVMAPRGDYPEVWRSFQQVIEGRRPSEYDEGPLSTRSGDKRIIMWRNAPIMKDGVLTGLLSFGLDVTRMRQTEARARGWEAQFRRFIEAAPDAIGAVQDGVYTYVNPALVRLLGYDRAEELLGRRLADLVHPDDREQLRRRTAAIMRDGGPLSPVLEYRLIRRDGSIATLEVIAIRVELEGGPGLLGWGRDVSERRRIEASLVQAERMATVGMLAAGIAHEINNPLAYLSLNLEMLQRLADAQPGGRQELDEIRHRLAEAGEAIGRVSAIVRNLRAFSRTDEQPHRPVDPGAAVRAALKLVDNQLRHRARLKVEIDSPPAVMADEGRLVQVVLNLVTNALQALPEHDAANQRIRVRAAAEDGGAAIEVIDSGPGVPPEVADRIFEPFFTTKPVGKGTGLGLSIAADIVRSFGGSISVHPADEGGARFRVLLPAATAKVGAEPAPPPERPACRPLRVLVVDDEPLIGRTVQAGLSPPHQVQVVTRAEDALGGALSGGFDIVLCDLMLPGMNGMDLHEEVARRAPALADRFVFMTGGTFTGRAEAFVSRERRRVLQKPFELDDLVALVEGWDGAAGAQAPAATSDRKRA